MEAACGTPGRYRILLMMVNASPRVTMTVKALARVGDGQLSRTILTSLPTQQAAVFPTCQAANRFSALVVRLTPEKVLTVAPLG